MPSGLARRCCSCHQYRAVDSIDGKTNSAEPDPAASTPVTSEPTAAGVHDGSTAADQGIDGKNSIVEPDPRASTMVPPRT